jgi:hypothetical protein
VLFVIASYRPPLWALAVMLVLMASLKAFGAWIYGSTDIWAMAAVAGGLRWGWPAVVLMLKPTLAPFALVGIRSRRAWLVTIIGLALFSVPMLPLWHDYLVAMRNLNLDPRYSLESIPLLLVPVVAWLGRTSAPARMSWSGLRNDRRVGHLPGEAGDALPSGMGR